MQVEINSWVGVGEWVNQILNLIIKEYRNGMLMRPHVAYVIMHSRVHVANANSLGMSAG